MTTCWSGPASVFEVGLLQPLAAYALEQLRQRFLYTLTTTHDQTKGARVLLQMAFETEVNTVLAKQVTLPAGLLEVVVCERRRFIDVDKDMQLQSYLVGPALDALAAIPNMPEPYVDFVRRYATTPYARYRVCALAAALCLAKVVQ